MKGNMSVAFGLCLSCMAAAASAQSGSFVSGSAADEAAIRAVVADAGADRANLHMAADLDWENAFGIRYTDLHKRDTFYHAVVTPLQKDDTDTTIEVKVRFLANGTAIADEYWHIIGQLDEATHKPGPDRWGRTTYVFVKQNGAWTEVLERVADLRLPYFKHFDSVPAGAVLPAGTLARLAGKYQYTDTKRPVAVSVEGDHLLFAGPKRTFVAVPTSATEFLLFYSRDDTAEYAKASFVANAAGTMQIKVVSEVDEPEGTLERLP